MKNHTHNFILSRTIALNHEFLPCHNLKEWKSAMHQSGVLHLILIFFTVSLFGCGVTRPILIPIDPIKQLQKDIHSVLKDSIFISTTAGIEVFSLDSGKVLFEHAGKTLMNPASNIKLLTSAAALAVLDTGYQFKTSVLINEKTTHGSVVRDIYLKGFGDPDLTTSGLDSLAYAIRNYGITRVEKNVIVDDSFFDDNYWGDGWAWDDESDPDAPSINALSVNKNCVLVDIAADSTSISISVEPNTDFITVVNRAEVVHDSVRVPLKIRRLSTNVNNTIRIDGEVTSFTHTSRKIPLRLPDYYTGVLFKESLLHAGVTVSGDVVSGIAPDGCREIATHEQPISTVVANMNKISDNLSAENILKVMGALRFNAPGTAKYGISVEKRFLADLGMDTTRFSIADGSGVSRYNLFNADQFVRFLAAMKKNSRLFTLFYNSLPIAGVDGTLENRMNNTPAANNVHAKTGTLNGVSCLSGYVHTRDGEMLAFSIMMQNFISSSFDYRLAQDKIGAILAGFSRTYRHR
jgi:serine-type D-Ala-D-Ala carboxypeptidase/endopeptidase (penicillin-binding protein 4)